MGAPEHHTKSPKESQYGKAPNLHNQKWPPNFNNLLYLGFAVSQLVPLHSVHTSLQCMSCCRHVHLFVLHSFLQLQDMMSSSYAGAAVLSVCNGRQFPSTMCHPIFLASYCHLFLSSTLHDSTLEGCGTLQPLRSVAEYVVPHVMCL